MLVYVVGEHYQSPARVLVNPVNTVGVMSSGPAFDFKRIYPDMFSQYQTLCQRDQFDVGKLLLYKSPHKWILNFPEKRHYRAGVKLDYIEEGLKKFVAIHSDYGMTSASFPAIGQDDDSLNWFQDVRPIMEAYLNPLPIIVYVHLQEADNLFTQQKRNIRSIKSWLLGQPSVVSFDKFWRDIQRVIQSHTTMRVFDAQLERFHVEIAKSNKNRRGRNLSLKVNHSTKPIFLSETVLMDLWHYVTRTGYVSPQNLPGGLDLHACYLVPLLDKLDYVHAVNLWTVGGERSVGLHYIPPISRQDDGHTVALA